jgi:predicted nucleic-acid-binding protein
MRMYFSKYIKRMSNMHSKLIRAEKKKLSLNQVIEFECICVKRGFLNVQDLS